MPGSAYGGVSAPDPSAEEDGAALIVDGGGYTFSSILASDWATQTNLEDYAKLSGRSGGQVIRGTPVSLGSELAPALVTPNWTLSGAFSYGTGPDRIVAAGGGGAELATPLVVSAGKTYRVVIALTISSGSVVLYFTGISTVNYHKLPLATGTNIFEVHSPYTSAELQFSGTFTGSIDSVSCKLMSGGAGALDLANDAVRPSRIEARGDIVLDGQAVEAGSRVDDGRAIVRGSKLSVMPAYGSSGELTVAAAASNTISGTTYFQDSVSFDDPLTIATAGGITAGTTQTQAGATQLSKGVNVVATVAVAGDGVKLSAAAVGLMQTVINRGANACQVWPTSGDDLGAGVDASISLPVGGTVEFICEDTTTWWPLWGSPRKVLQIVRATGDQSGNEATQSATLVETSLKKSITVRAGTTIRIRALIYILVDSTGVSGGRLGFVGLHRDTTAGELVAANGTEILPEYENGHALAVDATAAIHYAMLMYEWEEASPGAGTYEYTVCIRRGASTSGRVTYQNVAVKDSWIEITEEAVVYG